MKATSAGPAGVSTAAGAGAAATTPGADVGSEREPTVVFTASVVLGIGCDVRG